MEQTIIRKACFFFLFFLLGIAGAQAQLPNKVGSLLNAERSLLHLAKETSPYESLLSVTDKQTVLFTPGGPMEGLVFLKNRPNIADVMTWNPRFSSIAKSMDIGFTTGPVTFQRVGAPRRFGEYLTIWKRDRKGVWKIALRGVSEHYGQKDPSGALAGSGLSEFIEPDSLGYLKHRSYVRLNQRKDVVISNERLFTMVLKSDNKHAFNEFLSDDVQFFFPWNNPIEGKDAVLTFLEKQQIWIETEMTFVDRAYSGEWAYSYGKATVMIKEEPQTYHYIRVWQRQSDHQWRVLIEFYSE